MVELATVLPGEFVGKGGFINQSSRSINARALEDATLLAITPQSLTRLPAVIREKMILLVHFLTTLPPVDDMLYKNNGLS